jgi:signal transduction histidine kinase
MRYLTTMDVEAAPNGMGKGTPEEWSFLVLRALAMLGGMVALFLVPLRPEHQPHVAPLAIAFVAYKAILFLAIWQLPRLLGIVLLHSIAIDLVFISAFVWHTGGAESHFYLLFYLLTALVAVHFPPVIGLATAAAASVMYALASIDSPPGDWHHVAARVATLFLLSGALGYLSHLERLARGRAERLNVELREHQARLQRAYEDLRAVQERVVQSERLAAIGQMSAKVSHEVRNPLSAISLNAELLEDELEALPAERRAAARELMVAIRAQLDVLGGLTEEYLRFARLPKPKPEPVDVGRLAEALAEFLRPELARKGVTVRVAMPRAMPAVSADLGQVRQALMNLVRNAAEAMPSGGTVTLRAAWQDTAAELTVEDEGPGIPPEHAQRIFEPFFTTKEGGTGLGLAIARQIAVDHGGRLECELAPSGGSVFRLSLPLGGEAI